MFKYSQKNSFTKSELTISLEDGSREYSYDISGYISFERFFRERPVSFGVLGYFVKKLSLTGKKLEEEGRNINGLILEPEHIYLKLAADAGDIKLLYFPEDSDLKFEKEILSLCEYLLEHVDYSDKNAVILAYNLYKRVSQGIYIFDDLTPCI